MDDRVTSEQADQLRWFAELVSASPHNLVSRRARTELLSRHIPECVGLARLLPGAGSKILDLGSGGGFPGLVIAIVRPDLRVDLLDATAKKTQFLTETAAVLGVHVNVHTGRAEDLHRDRELSSAFDVVTARAVAPLSRLTTWALPFLQPGGLLYAMKGERWAEELAEARDVIATSGASVVATPDDLPDPEESPAATHPRVVMLARAA